MSAYPAQHRVGERNAVESNEAHHFMLSYFQMTSDLPQQLLSYHITPQQFIDAIFALDQSTPQRDNAETNLTILTNPEVKKFFESQSTQLYDQYANCLSLTYFHLGQRSQFIQTDNQQAVQFFSQALESAQNISDQQLIPWTAYIAGTIAFLEHKPEALQNAINQIPDTDDHQTNRQILQEYLTQITNS